MSKRLALSVSMIFGGVLLAACDEKLSTVAGPTPNLEPTFTSIQRDIFEAADSSGRPRCVNCHNNIGAVRAGGLNLMHDVAYAQLVNAPVSGKPGAIRVVPGDVTNSYLVQKLLGTSGIVGVRMPQNGPFLSDGQILIIQRWIQLGAPRN